MSDENKTLWIIAAALLLVCSIGAAAMVALNNAKCSAKWEQSGFTYRYSILGGCQIETAPGRWIWTENYREGCE